MDNKEFDYLEQFEDEVRPALTEDIIDRFTDINRTELFKRIMEPDIKKEVLVNNEFPLLTKEFKVANLDFWQLESVVETTDLINNLLAIGAVKSAKMLAVYVNTILSASVSKNATFLRLTTTTTQIYKEERTPNKRSFLRGD